MGLSMEGKATTLPGIVLTVLFTVIGWIAIFSGGWYLGLAITGSEIGAAAGAVFPALAHKLVAKFWTK